MRPVFERLARADDATLDRLFATAAAPSFDELVGHEWLGFNTDPLLARLGLRKFTKAFFRADHGDEGCNIKIWQDGLDAPWRPRLLRNAVDTFAYYLVRQQDERTRLPRNQGALVIDYAASPRNPPWHIERIIRDYLVRPVADEPDVMLGRAFLGVGRARVASTFFVLERGGPFGWPVRRAPGLA